MREGVTKLEFLVAGVLGLFVIGFLAILLARHRDNAVRVECVNNLRMIGQATLAYHDASSADKERQYLPPTCIAEGYATWAVLIAPHLTKENPLLRWESAKSYFAQSEEARQARVFAYFCPARRRSDFLSQAGDVDAGGKQFPGGLGDYGAVSGDGTADNGALAPAANLQRAGDRVVSWESQTGLDALPRGQAYTLLLGEKHVPVDAFGLAAAGDGSLYNGANLASFARVAGPGFPLARTIDEPYQKNFGSSHARVCNFLFADGSVQPMSVNISETVLGALARRGE